MKQGGIVLWVVSGLLLAYSLVMDTTAPNTNTVNLSLMQFQLMLWQAGLALLIAGSVLFAADFISTKNDASTVSTSNPIGQDQQPRLDDPVLEATDEANDSGKKDMIVNIVVGVGLALLLGLLALFAD